MNALSTPEPIRSRRPVSRPRRHPQRQRQSVVALEIFVKVIANCIVSLAAITALIKLLPHHFSQYSKLNDIKQEVNVTEKRVQEIRDQLEYTLGTGSEDEIMTEQTGKKDPQKLPIVFKE